MKNLILFLISICSLINLNAQDVLYLKSGFEVQVKVYEIGKKEIKYKKYNNLDGPVYTADIKNIKSIKYQNGEEETFEPIKGNKSFEILPNAMSINYGELFTGRIGIAYTRIFKSKNIGIKVPVSLNFLNNYYGNSVKYYAGFDLNFYPLGQKRLTYYTGLGVRAGLLSHQYYYPYYDYLYYPQVWYNPQESYFIGGYVNNGITLNITSHFSISGMIGIGIRDIEGYSWAEPSAIGELNMSIRF